MMREAYARTADPMTSHNAADRVEAVIPRLEKLVLDHLEERRRNDLGGSTSKEIAHALGLDHVTISPRMRPLCNRGMIRESGEKRDRSIIWEIV